MAKVSSGISLSTDYFMRNFYANNRNAMKTTGRKEYSDIELSYEDSLALSRAAKRLLRSEYKKDSSQDKDDDNIDDTTKASVEAFVKTYNNAIDSGKKSSDYDTKRYLKQIKNLTKKHADELEDLGISIESDGTLTVNDNLLKCADRSKAKKLFSSDEEYSKKVLKLSKKFNTAVQDNIYAQVNQKRLHINITL